MSNVIKGLQSRILVYLSDLDIWLEQYENEIAKTA